MEPKRFTFKRRNVKSSKEDVGRKSRLSRIRSKGGESNGVQASDMDVYTTSNTKEVAKEGTKHMESGSIHEDSVLGWEILLELMSLRVLKQRLELCGKHSILEVVVTSIKKVVEGFVYVRASCFLGLQETKAGLVTGDWIEDIWGSKNFGFAQVPANAVIALDRKESDHCPIVLKDISVDFGSKPFRVFDILLEDPDVEKIIVEAWDEKLRQSRHLDETEMREWMEARRN
ncbi:hypothetical protein Tco_1229789 [Tanacetum coccineum]